MSKCIICNGPSDNHNCMEYLTGRVRELEDIIEGWEHTAMMAASAGTKVDACNIVDDYICQLSNKE